MILRIEVAEQANIAFPESRIDSVSATSFQDQLVELIGRSDNVVVDCADVEYVSSAGLRALLVAAKSAQTKGVKFAVCSLKSHVKEIFTVSGFDNMVQIHPDRETALA
ncbi:MAG: STAS domain-containing protein [Novosphingobium sp.]|jgi:anti-sigma B factor antagonist|uniref:STAS domain-containing protein n=1 Tax=Novosphingobium sp. TaxID=1874826 RepID=UPI003018CD1F